MLSKSQARFFFLGGTIVSFAIFLGLSWKTLSDEVPKNTHSENLTPEVVRGKQLWESNNCMGCHTILGEGAYYAPELTKVMERRGEAYVKLVLTSENPWAPRGRKMVAYGFSDQEAADLISFLTWIGNTDLNGFPAKPKYNNTNK
jgi:nitric oxide reductase subunit C